MLNRDRKSMVVGCITVPKPVSVVGTQITSSKRETRLSAVVIAFPYLKWKGSSIVIQFLSLIWLTNKAPPTFRKRGEENNQYFLTITCGLLSQDGNSPIFSCLDITINSILTNSSERYSLTNKERCAVRHH